MQLGYMRLDGSEHLDIGKGSAADARVVRNPERQSMA